MTGKDTQKNYATLLIIITPHVIRGTQAAGHSPMMRVEKNAPRRDEDSHPLQSARKPALSTAEGDRTSW